MRKEPFQKQKAQLILQQTKQIARLILKYLKFYFSISYLRAKLEISSFKHWYTIRLTEEIGGSVNAALVYF